MRLNPLPDQNLVIRPTFDFVRVVELKVEEWSFLLDALCVMEYLDHECDVMIGHFPPDIVLNQVHSNRPGQVPIAYILALRARRPHSQARRWYQIKEAELAVEEKLGEARLWECCPVEVSEAEFVRVSVRGGEIFRCFLTVAGIQ